MLDLAMTTELIETTDELTRHIQKRLEPYKAPEATVARLAQQMGVLLTRHSLALDPDGSLFNFEGKILASIALLGVRKDEFVVAALKQPQLFYQSPETLNGNVEGSAALLGVRKDQFVALALKHPPLFYQSPETIARHAMLAGKLYIGGHVTLSSAHGKPSHALDTRPVLDWLCQINPFILSLADDNFHLRQELANLRGKPKPGNILIIPRHRVEREVARRLGHHDPARPVHRGTYDPSRTYDNPSTQAERHGRLCHLIERGLIKSIPLVEGMAPALAPLSTSLQPAAKPQRDTSKRKAIPVQPPSRSRQTPAELTAAFMAYRARQAGGTQP